MDAFVDTSILIDIHRGHSSALIWLQAHQELRLGITPLVWMEILIGAENKLAQKRAVIFLSRFPIIYLTQEDQEWATRQFQMYRLSHNVGLVDCLIAAPAHRLQLPLYTRNLKHFAPLLGGLAVQAY